MMLVHMNGRIYDPVLARFMMADPLIQSASSLQDYNRYSYVNNNPFTGVDPSGYSRFSHAVHSVANSVGGAFGLFGIRQQIDFAKSVSNSEVGRIVTAVQVTYYTASLSSDWVMNKEIPTVLDLNYKLNPLQRGIDKFVMDHPVVYTIGQAAATYFTAFCGGWRRACSSAYYNYAATGSTPPGLECR